MYIQYIKENSMKSLQQFFDEILADEKMKAEMAKIETEEELESFISSLGCNATIDEVKAFIAEQRKNNLEVSEEELSDVAGGTSMITSMIFQFICK